MILKLGPEVLNIGVAVRVGVMVPGLQSCKITGYYVSSSVHPSGLIVCLPCLVFWFHLSRDYCAFVALAFAKCLYCQTCKGFYISLNYEQSFNKK